MTKSLDEKLSRIRKNPACRDFILADAKDADMAHGLAAPGKSPEMHGHEARFRTLQDYRDLIRENTRQGLVDIMLMSASTNEVLTLGERLFDKSHVTPAIRANDTTDIWLAAGSTYGAAASRPFRSATIDHAMCGRVACEPQERKLGADLGLYSMTFNNDRDHDHEALTRYAEFRVEAEKKGFRHFLEVFAPNAPAAPLPDVGRYINDMIVRTLAGVVGAGRPAFLKIPYNGPEAMEALAGYDRELVVGILGGSAGTTHDAFNQLWEAKKYGARVALYGRMINASEHQTTFVEHLRAVADDHLSPTEAVKGYHAALQKLNIKAYRPLEDDLKLTARTSAYSGGSAPKKEEAKKAAPAPASPAAAAPAAKAAAPAKAQPAPAASGNSAPDFSRMSPQEKVQWNLKRWNRILG